MDKLHKKIVPQNKTNNPLLQLLEIGNLDVVDTSVELEFLLKHVNDPVDTLMEIKLYAAVMNNLNKLAGEMPAHSKEHKLVSDILDTLTQQQSPRPIPPSDEPEESPSVRLR